ncbi:MAG TPA: PAS domain S-box protein, partial [Syntrophorhabdales bacterium]|nr:PAS domain S-box protein [Syntrophorhabdales bacterium]
MLADGTVRHVHTIRHPVLNDAGDVVQLVGTTMDITERKRAEEALEAKSRGLQEANTALKVLLEHRDEDRRELEERVVSNVKQLVL